MANFDEVETKLMSIVFSIFTTSETKHEAFLPHLPPAPHIFWQHNIKTRRLSKFWLLKNVRGFRFLSSQMDEDGKVWTQYSKIVNDFEYF